MERNSVPDYDLDDTMALTSSIQVQAIGNRFRTTILGLLHERAASVSEIAAAVDRPKSTVAYHVNVLSDAGLVRVVRTRRVRAIDERYFGRTARMFYVGVGARPRDEAVPVGLERPRHCGAGVPAGVSGSTALVIHPPRPDSTRASRRVLGRGTGAGSRVRPPSPIRHHRLRVRDRPLPDPGLPGAARA